MSTSPDEADAFLRRLAGAAIAAADAEVLAAWADAREADLVDVSSDEDFRGVKDAPADFDWIMKRAVRRPKEALSA
jgi:hypothetical protein